MKNLILLILLLAGCAQTPVKTPVDVVQTVPIEAPKAHWSSKAFFATYNQPGLKRDAAIVKEVLKGNVPSWMFKLQDVEIGGQIVQVTPDYLAIGLDNDFVRVPVTPIASQYLADKLGYSLPLEALVREIHAQASVRLMPKPTDWYKNDALMRLGTNYLVFNNTINSQLTAVNFGKFVSGHKKDVLGVAVRGKVTIFGWIQANGRPIQPVFSGHDDHYEDYSHGIRFVKDPSGKYSGKSWVGTYPKEFLN